jgi:hypothetical protein
VRSAASRNLSSNWDSSLLELELIYSSTIKATLAMRPPPTTQRHGTSHDWLFALLAVALLSSVVMLGVLRFKLSDGDRVSTAEFEFEYGDKYKHTNIFKTGKSLFAKLFTAQQLECPQEAPVSVHFATVVSATMCIL